MAEPNDWTPRKVVLFSGHMIDAPGREKPRFPPDKEHRRKRDRSRARRGSTSGRATFAICGGACGGDLLFAEAALARSARGSNSISRWTRRRFSRNRSISPAATGAPGSLRRRRKRRCTCCRSKRGETPEGEDPYERNNLWMLDAASRFGPDKVDLGLPLERRGRRRAGRRAAHDGRGPKSGAGGRCGSTRRSSGGDGEASGPFTLGEGENNAEANLFHDHAIRKEADPS